MKLKYSPLILIAFVVAIVLGACSKNDEPETTVELRQSTLLYAVNLNSLYEDLSLNISQITQAMTQLPNGEYNLYVFKTDDPTTYGLYKITSGPKAEMTLVRNYKRDKYATNPAQLRKVINEFLSYDLKVPVRNMILWGHGTAWFPHFSDHVMPASSHSNSPQQGDFPENHAYGGDNYSRDWMDIHELAQAIPSNVFDMILFDCCYMSNIECVYQLRNKSKYLIGYPTEIIDTGLPYHSVLPHIFKPEPAYVEAAQEIFNLYDSRNWPVTVAVMDMSKLPEMVASAKKIIKLLSYQERSWGKDNKLNTRYYPSTSGRLDYGRWLPAPLYDFGNMLKDISEANEQPSYYEEFLVPFNEFMIYRKASERDFKGQYIPQDQFHGISSHLFMDSGSDIDEYYKTLDWYKAVYK